MSYYAGGYNNTTSKIILLAAMIVNCQGSEHMI